MIHNAITGTHPVHLHANGNARVLGWAKAFFDGVLAAQREAPPLPPRPCAVEVAVYSDYPAGTTAVEVSCRYWGVEPVRLAYPKQPGEKWRYYWKTEMAIAHLERTAAEWVLFSDATDVVFARHPCDALAALDGTAMLSAERNNWPADCPVTPQGGAYPHGNSGGVLGRRGVLLDAYRLALPHRSTVLPTCDQYGLRIACNELGIPVDTDARVFQSLAYTEPGEVEAT